jgi:hypothetical protein
MSRCGVRILGIDMFSKQVRSFLKKRTKKLLYIGSGVASAQVNEVFLLLFVHKKKTLSSLEVIH